MSIDLQAMVNAAMVKMHEEGVIQKIVEEKIAKTVSNIVDDVLGSYSDFGKQVKEVVKQSLAIDVDKMELPTYNVLVRNVVRERLDQLVHVQGIELLKARMDEIFKTVESEMKLSEIVENWKEALNEDHERDGEHITVTWEPSTYSSGGGWLYIDEEEDKSNYQCDLRAGINKDGTIFALHWKSHDLLKEVKTTWAIDSIGEQFFRMHAAGSKIIVDMDEVEKYFGYDD
jgi:hypothetical protein